MHTLKKILLFCFVIISISCEKEFNMKLKETSNIIAVEGKIENDFPPYILLTNSFSIYKDFNINSLTNLFIQGANISIFHNNDTIHLKEYNSTNIHEMPDSFQVELAERLGFDIAQFGGSFPPFVSIYTIDFSKMPLFVGELGQTYGLEIKVQDKILTASTSIPNRTVHFDSLWLETHPNPAKFPDYYQLTGILSDNGSTTDYYRYATKVDEEPWLVSNSSVFDDVFFNGKKFKIFIPKGNRFGDTPDPLDETVGYWNNQDSVLTFKLSLIDRPHYDFWRTLESNRSSQGSPFGSFVVVKSNIQGGGVGIWGGYASYTHHFYRF
ncbi:MAG: DUF4249 family protein [Chitinophagales bacterium]|nr:DUF4249 family protein [Chitinophagales bacterium]